MSIKIMTLVWDSCLDRELKFVALAYADWADDDGGNIYPATDRVAWKTGYSERQVRSITRKLREMKILIPQGKSAFGTNLYRMSVAMLPRRPPYVPPLNGRPRKNDPLDDEEEAGAEIAPGLEKSRCKNCRNQVQKIAKVGAETAPDPSYIHQLTITRECENSPAISVADAYRERTRQALQHGLETHQEDVLAGIDLTGYPADVCDLIREVCREWGFKTPTQKARRAKWIQDARELKHVCGELGMEPVRRERKRVLEYMREHQGVAPYTYKDIGSIVGPVGGMAAQMRTESQLLTQPDDFYSELERQGYVIHRSS